MAVPVYVIVTVKSPLLILELAFAVSVAVIPSSPIVPALVASVISCPKLVLVNAPKSKR